MSNNLTQKCSTCHVVLGYEHYRKRRNGKLLKTCSQCLETRKRWRYKQKGKKYVPNVVLRSGPQILNEPKILEIPEVPEVLEIPEVPEVPKIQETPSKLAKFKYNEIFDPKCSSGYSVGIIGSSRSGKSTFIRELYPKIKKMNDITIFVSQTLNSTNIYDFVDRDFVIDHLDETMLQFIMSLQKKTNSFLKIAIFFDDVTNLGRSKEILDLMTIGRNYRISVIISIQDFRLMGSVARNNCNFMFLLRNNSGQAAEAITKLFLRDIVETPAYMKDKVHLKMEYLRKYYKEHTDNHNMLVIDYLNGGNIYGYKVKLDK